MNNPKMTNRPIRVGVIVEEPLELVIGLDDDPPGRVAAKGQASQLTPHKPAWKP